MQHAYGLSIPQTLVEACRPQRTALLVYDMQVGITAQIADADTVVDAVIRVRDAARAGGYRVIYTRHMSVPNSLAGVSTLRTAMAWQHIDDVALVRPAFPQGSPQYQLVPQLTPNADELVVDKVTMSAFAGTPIDIILRDCRIDSFAIVGIAMEVGIEPTVRHGMDLGYLPIIVSDACGAGDTDAAQRSYDTLRFAGGSLVTDTATLVHLFSAT